MQYATWDNAIDIDKQRISCHLNQLFGHNSYNFTIVLAPGTDVHLGLMSRLDDLVRIHKNFPCARCFFVSLRN
jgi:hypothetical protein